MRVGRNPNQASTTDYRPPRVTVCVLVSIPNETGYHAHRLDVVNLCLTSLFKYTRESAYDLLVFDNGSCPKVVEWLESLREQGRIHYLMLSARNIGKANAYRMMFQMAPGEVIAYADDDVLFYPGWLGAQLRVLDTFPRVGMVSGVPVRHQFRYGNAYLDAYLTDFPEVTVTRGRLIPDEWELDFLTSTGRDAPRELDTTHEIEDVLLTYKGESAYSTAVHFQYVAFKTVILEGLSMEFDSRLMREPIREVDERIDALGYARLSTTTRVVRHIGNVVSKDLAEEVAGLGLSETLSIWAPPSPVARWLAQSSGMVRRLKNWHYFASRYRPPR